MKHLLYLNRDYLYSYYAQAFEGLEQTRQKEVTDLTASKEEQLSEVVVNKSAFSAQIPKILKMEAGRNVTDESLNTSYITLEAAREVATVTLHDNALNDIIKHSNAESNTDKALGSYVVEKGYFSIIDFKYWLDILTDSTLSFLAEQMWKERINKLPNPEAKAIQNGKKTFIDEKTKELKELRKSIESLNAFNAFDLALILNNMIVPLKQNNLKETTKEINFKYESEISVFGRITRKSRSINNNSNGIAGSLNVVLTQVWIDMLKALQALDTDRGVIVIDPIAVYVE